MNTRRKEKGDGVSREISVYIIISCKYSVLMGSSDRAAVGLGAVAYFQDDQEPGMQSFSVKRSSRSLQCFDWKACWLSG